MFDSAHQNTNRVGLIDGVVPYKSLESSISTDEALQPNDFTLRYRRFESSDSVNGNKRVIGNSFYKLKDDFTCRSESSSILSPVHFNAGDRSVLNSDASLNKYNSKFTGVKCSPKHMVEQLYKSNSSSMSIGSSAGNKTSRLSQTYFGLDVGMKENVNISHSPDFLLNGSRAFSYRVKGNSFHQSARENYRNGSFQARSYAGLSPEQRYSDGSSGILTHQSKYAGPGQLPRVCLGRPNMLLTFSGASLSKCVQSPVRAKPSSVLPKTRAYRLVSDLSPRFSTKFEEMSRKRIRNSHEEDDDDDDVAKRQCKADELSNSDDLEEDCVNLKRAREDSPKSDLDQHHQKPKKRVCNNEILSSLSSSKNLLHTSARKRKAAFVDWSRSSTPVQEKLFKKSIGSPDISANNQEVVCKSTEVVHSPSQEKSQQVEHGASDKLRKPDETVPAQLKKSVEQSRVSNYTLFDVPISQVNVPTTGCSPISTYADLSTSLEAAPKTYTEKKTFDTKELEREAISKRLSSFWDAFGSVDVNKARNAMAPSKSTHILNNVSTQVVAATTSAPIVHGPNTLVYSTLQQPSVLNTSLQKDTQESVNLIHKNDSTSTAATSAESIFTYGQSLSRSRELPPSLNLKKLVESSGTGTVTNVTSSQTATGQNKFSISSSPSAPIVEGSGLVSLTGSHDLQRSESTVSLSTSVQPTVSSFIIPSSEVETPSTNVQSHSVQDRGTVSHTSDTSISKPSFGFTSTFSPSIKNNTSDGKQNLNVANEKNVGGFSFSFTAPTSTIDANIGKPSAVNFSVPPVTCSSVSSTSLVLKPASSIATSPGQGGHSFPTLGSNDTNSNNQVVTSKAPSIFGSSQSLMNGFGSSQKSGIFASSQPQALAGGFTVSQTPASGFGVAQTPATGFGVAQTPASGFGVAQTPASGFGASQTPASGFGASQTPASGFGVSQTPASGFGVAQPPASGFGVTQTSASGFGVTQTSASGFGVTQTPTSGFSITKTPTSGFSITQTPASGLSITPQTPANGLSITPQTPASRFSISQAPASGFGNIPISVSGKVEAASAFGNTQSQGFGSTQLTSTGGLGSVQVSASNLGSATSASGFGNLQATSISAFGNTTPKSGFESNQTTTNNFGNVPTTSAGGFGTAASNNIFSTLQTANSTGSFSFGATSVQKTTSAFVFGASTVTTSSASTPVQSSGFGNATLIVRPQVSQSMPFEGAAVKSKNQPSTDNAKSILFNFGGVSATPNVGGFSFVNSQSSQPSPSTSVSLNFVSNVTSSQASSSANAKFTFGAPQSQSSGILTTQPQLSFGSGVATSLPQTQSPFAASQPETALVAQKPNLSFGTQQPSFGVQQVQTCRTETMVPQSQSLFGSMQQQGSGSSSLMQQPQTGGVNPLAQSTGQQPSLFGSQAQQPQSSGGFSFASKPQPTTESSVQFGMSPQASTFQFGAAQPAASQSVGGFNFGNVASSSTGAAVNFSAGSNTNSPFQVGAASSFGGGGAAGMFNIGSGSTAPRAKSMRSSRRSALRN